MPDYTFYVEDYLGEDIPEKEFPRFIRRAGDELRRRGGDAGEYGATTGRPRRVGWFDAVATRYGCMVQGATEVVLTEIYTAPPELCSRTLADRAAHFRHEAGYYLRIGRWLLHE